MGIIFISLVVILVSTLLFYIFLFAKKKRKTTFESAEFGSFSCKSNGIVPSTTDEQLESWKCPDVSYFFACNRESRFQLTLKKKSRGCFFVLKFEHNDLEYENCGFLEEETDGFRFDKWHKLT